MCFRKFKKSKPRRNGRETLPFPNLSSTLQGCGSMSRSPLRVTALLTQDWCEKQRSWETYFAFICDHIPKITLSLGCQPDFFVLDLSQQMQEKHQQILKNYRNRIHRNKEQLRRQLKTTSISRDKSKYYKIWYLSTISDLQQLLNDLSHRDLKFRSLALLIKTQMSILISRFPESKRQELISMQQHSNFFHCPELHNKHTMRFFELFRIQWAAWHFLTYIHIGKKE